MADATNSIREITVGLFVDAKPEPKRPHVRLLEDIDRLGAAQHRVLVWQRHEGVAMKGFPGAFTLWSLRK